jgi:hypothetical protein
MKSPFPRAGALALAILVLNAVASRVHAADTPVKKPVFLYTRYFNAQGESRYLPDGTYKDVLGRLAGEFEVRVGREPLAAGTLKDVNVLLISNPSDKASGMNPPPRHISAEDAQTIADFVQRGGGLIVLGNQENHNLEVEDVNKLLGRFGLQFTNLYTDVKKIVVPRETPVIGGLRWGYYTGNLVLAESGHPAKPRSLVLNDPGQKPIKGDRNQTGPLLAVAEPGRGHVVVATDAGWISNDALSEKGIGGVAIHEQDNWEIFRRLSRWAADGSTKF